MSMFAILKRPGVARLGAAGLLSEIGDWMLFIALPLFVLQLTGSPLVTATVFVLELVPTVVIGPLAGVLVDRFEPWRLMATVAALQAVLLLPLLLVQSADDLWLVYAVVVAESVLGTVIEPCRTVTAASLVPVTDLMTVNQLTGILSSLARLVGAPLGGLTLGLTGIDGVLVADTATFVAAAALFGWKVGRPAQAVRAEPAAPVRLLADWGRDWRSCSGRRYCVGRWAWWSAWPWLRAPSSCSSCCSSYAISAAPRRTSAPYAACRRSELSPAGRSSAW